MTKKKLTLLNRILFQLLYLFAKIWFILCNMSFDKTENLKGSLRYFLFKKKKDK